MEKQPPLNLKDKIQSFWEKEKIYKFNPSRKGEIFSIDTPPPTMSGKMHLGHAFSYTQQDLIARYQRMSGKNVFYPFGTDDNGLATEKWVEKENKVNIFKTERNDFVKLCRQTIKKLRPKFIQDWKDLGISCDFNLDYSTISKDVQKLSQKFFIDVFNKKRAYRKKAPTLWCVKCQTAISQAETEDKESKSVFYDIAFDFDNGKKIIIATTRPELLSSCVAVFINPRDKRYSKLLGKEVSVPIFNQKVRILSDKKVDQEKGTGAVMCSTFGDVTDIEWYLFYNLELRASINKDGTMNERAGKYKGLSVSKCRKKIIDDLKTKKVIISEKQISHFVNTHERCSKKIEIIETTQWFIKYLDLKNDFINFGRKINWHPEFMRKRYENWVNGLCWDWCISRQRSFGIPFPLWYCQKCGKVKIADFKDLPIDPAYFKPKTKCLCGCDKFIAEKDVMDTWATSSLTPQIAESLIKKKKKEKIFPMSLRPQAHDIINFWLFYTIARSKIHINKIPWKSIMISGFVLDPKGDKMSKSKGNVVSPSQIIEKYGVDPLRHWAAKAGLGEDLRLEEKEIKTSKRTIIKLWNATRFSFLNLTDYRPSKKINYKNLQDEDRWILHLLQEMSKKYHSAFKDYKFKKAREAIDNFFWKIFCDNYLEIIKQRLSSESKEKKKNTQDVLYKCLFEILKFYSPFIPFICEEIFQNLFRKSQKEKSVHQCVFSKIENKFKNQKVKDEFDNVIESISIIRKYRSENGLSFKKEIAKAVVKTNGNIKKYESILKSSLNIEKIEFKKINNNKIKIEIF